MELGLDLKLRSWSWNWSWNLRSWNWSWSWNLRSWSWSWSWYSGDLPELELELELKPPELELELELIFWRLAGVGVGVETSGVGVGVGVDIMELTPTLMENSIDPCQNHWAINGQIQFHMGTETMQMAWILNQFCQEAENKNCQHGCSGIGFVKRLRCYRKARSGLSTLPSWLSNVTDELGQYH